MKRLRKLVSMCLCLCMVFGLCIPKITPLQAASKPYLSDKSLTIPIGNEHIKLDVKNRLKSATYSFVVKNRKVVTISKSGELTGVSKGSTYVSVYQTYKKKKTKVGTCRITVKAATIGRKDILFKYYSNPSKDLNCDLANIMEFWDLILYRNPNASYYYYSSNSKVLTVTKAGKVTSLGKPGQTATLTIKEYYKKHMRTVGTVKIKIGTPGLITKELDVTVNSFFNPFYYIGDYEGPYIIVCSNSKKPDFNPDHVIKGAEDKNKYFEFQKDDKGKWNEALTPLKAGTQYIHYYIGNPAKVSKNSYLGTLKVNIKYVPATELKWSGYDESEFALGDYKEDNPCLTFTKEPYECSDTPIITSSDSNIVEIDEEYVYFGDVKLKLKKAGTVTITVKLGKLKISKTITVVDD